MDEFAGVEDTAAEAVAPSAAGRIVFQGQPGAYSHLACRQMCPDLRPVPVAAFEDAIVMGKGWETDGVVRCSLA